MARFMAPRTISQRAAAWPRQSRLERVAVGDAAAFESALEPLHALRARAVRERLRNDVAARLALQAVVADCARGVQSFGDVALLEDVPHLVGVIRPDAGEAVRLQLRLDRDR